MAQTENTLQISHINIRISISILVFKLFVVEIFSLAVVIAFYTLLFTAQNTSMIFVTIGSLSIPLLIILAILKFALTLFIIIQWINEYYEITTTAIFHRRGVIFRNEEKYLLTHIQMIVVHQTLIGRMFNFGTIELLDYRRNKLEDMYLIHNPVRYAHVIESLLPGSDEKKIYIRGGIEEESFDD